MRILWVVPRYGRGIAGGAETLVRALATRCAAMGWTAEVATTCARDHVTWADELPAGTSVEDGVAVHRFPVGPRDARRYDALHAAIVSGRAGYADELEWLVAQRLVAGDAGVPRGRGRPRPARAVAVPVRHHALGRPGGARSAAPCCPACTTSPTPACGPCAACWAPCAGASSTPPPRSAWPRRLAPVRDGGVVGMGFDPPDGPAAGPPPAATRDLGPYLVYAGRLEEGKRVQVAVEHVVAARGRAAATRPALVLMGRGGYRPPAVARAAGSSSWATSPRRTSGPSTPGRPRW